MEPGKESANFIQRPALFIFATVIQQSTVLFQNNAGKTHVTYATQHVQKLSIHPATYSNFRRFTVRGHKVLCSFKANGLKWRNDK